MEAPKSIKKVLSVRVCLDEKKLNVMEISFS